MQKVTSMGSRLKAERKRLGYNLTTFAEVAGVVKSAQSNYENDVRVPDANYFNALRAKEPDFQLLWVLTGDAQYLDNAEPLEYRPEQRRLLENYDLCTDDQKATLRTMAQMWADERRAFAKANPTRVVTAD